jgi:hypothetical protein
MKQNKGLKKLIETIGNEHDQETMASLFEAEGEKELADFVRSVKNIKNEIEPDRSLLLNILNDISTRQSSMSTKIEAPVITKVGLQLHMNRILKFAIPSALVILIAIGIWANPFKSENTQVAVIKDISKEEKKVDQASSAVQSYLNRQKNAVPSSQANSPTAITAGIISTTTPFDTTAIANEANSIGYDPGLAQFIAQEKSMSAIDATLANF